MSIINWVICYKTDIDIQTFNANQTAMIFDPWLISTEKKPLPGANFLDKSWNSEFCVC